MSDLRIIHQNDANDAALTASTTAGGLVAANMLNDRKGLFHRSAGVTVTYTLTWPERRSMGGVGMLGCNYTSDATIRVRGYDAATAGNQLFDTGLRWACPGPNLGDWDFTDAINVNAFTKGLPVKVGCWFGDHYAARRLVIDIQDMTNPLGYLECGRLVVGGYWEPAHSADYGSSSGPTDTSKSTRTGAGDLLSDWGSINDAMKIDLSVLRGVDRARMHHIMMQNGTTVPMFISLCADSDDARLEQENMIYGKRQNAPVAFTSYNIHSTSVTIEGW